MSETRDYIIGKRYNVPCVTLGQRWGHFNPGECIPVIGPRHEDKDIIGFKAEHWHIDFRFVRKDRWKEMESGYYGYARIHGSVIKASFVCRGPALRRLACKRWMPTFPTHIPFRAQAMRVPWLPKLEKAYAGARMKCLTCPHRGIPLTGIAAQDGVVVCPGHGLAWNVNTGELVRRTKREAVPA